MPLGVLAAARQGSRFDHVVRVVSLAGQSVPVFVLGLLCLLVFYVKLGIAPGTGQLDVALRGHGAATSPACWWWMRPSPATGMRSGTRWRIWRSRRWCWPISAMAYHHPHDARLHAGRAAGEYIITARAKGLSATRILWRHAFGNIAVRLITVLALAYAGLLEGAVLTETVFSWPGLGLYLTVRC